MFRLLSNGNFDRTRKRLERLMDGELYSDLDRYGRIGVDALARATPVDTGLSSESWYYRVDKDNGRYSISWHNDNTVNGTPVVILLQYGHGTGTGGWVSGRDFINPAIQPIFDEIASDVWKKVTA